mmetsp:Transcript_38634/g.90328  ORF Transcript_38634/g.90328 Transcript_38634/m.90328 type:complete len:214 (-) Transcript_38634:813-1454(-)
MSTAPWPQRRLDRTMAATQDLPPGCSFHCRDNMTDVCSKAAVAGACAAYPEVMRFQCPAACGVCKGVAMEIAAPGAYPKYVCRLSSDDGSGDDPAHAESCKDWAAAGECAKNWGFMSVACEQACGLCDSSKPPAPRKGKSEKSDKGAKKKGFLRAVTPVFTPFPSRIHPKSSPCTPFYTSCTLLTYSCTSLCPTLARLWHAVCTPLAYRVHFF